MQEVRVLGKALSCGRGLECPLTQDTKGGKDQVDCMCASAFSSTTLSVCARVCVCVWVGGGGVRERHPCLEETDSSKMCVMQICTKSPPLSPGSHLSPSDMDASCMTKEEGRGKKT